MRTALTVSTFLYLCAPLHAQQPDPAANRFRIDVDLDAYPQSNPKVALQSVLRAADAGRYDYLVAHLIDPAYADKQASEAGSFQKFVGIVRQKWTNDPEGVKELRRFASDGTWNESGDRATAKLKDIPTRQVFLKRVGNRWYLENRQKEQP